MFSRRWLWKHVAAVFCFAICVGGAWWQTDRAGSPTGTWQNAGYAAEWPLFALFVIWAWFRMMQLEARQLAKAETEQQLEQAPETPAPTPAPVLVKAGVKTEDDPELNRYNNYLAWLAEQDD